MIWSIIFFSHLAFISDTTSLNGFVKDFTGKPVLFADVAVFKNDVLVAGCQSNLVGFYSISNLDPGTYDIQVSYVGLQTTKISGVVVFANKENRLEDIVLRHIVTDEIIEINYEVPILENAKGENEGISTAAQIRNLPVKDIDAMAIQISCCGVRNEREVCIRSGRTNMTNYYINGVRYGGRRCVPLYEIDILVKGIQTGHPESNLPLLGYFDKRKEHEDPIDIYEVRDHFGKYSFVNEHDNIVLEGVVEARINEYELRRFRP